MRAAAGEWIKVTVLNCFDQKSPVFQTTNTVPYGTPFNDSKLPSVPLRTSYNVGLHPQLLAYNPVNANGLIVGFNPQSKLIAPEHAQAFYSYAGDVSSARAGTDTERATP